MDGQEDPWECWDCENDNDEEEEEDKIRSLNLPSIKNFKKLRTIHNHTYDTMLVVMNQKNHFDTAIVKTHEFLNLAPSNFSNGSSMISLENF